MNGDQLRRLRLINSNAMRAEGHNVMRKEDTHKNQREMWTNMYNDTRLSDHARNMAKKQLSNPKLHEIREHVDFKEAARVEKKVDQDIKREIAQGRLEDPSKSVDKFMKDKWK